MRAPVPASRPSIASTSRATSAAVNTPFSTSSSRSAISIACHLRRRPFHVRDGVVIVVMALAHDAASSQCS